jgi:hypothetical protein
VKIFGYLIYIGFEILEQESNTLPEPDSRQMLRNFLLPEKQGYRSVNAPSAQTRNKSFAAERKENPLTL